MSYVSSEPNIDLNKVMATFAQYGFRKASMDDIARSAGLSRQSLYKKFGSKDGCYDWVLKSYMSTLYGRTFDLIEQGNGSIESLQHVFTSVIADGFEHSHSAHGAELLEDALEAAASLPENLPSEFEKRIGDYLVQHTLADSPDHGAEMAHVLITASRGALLNAASREAYSEDMARVLTAVFPKAKRS